MGVIPRAFEPTLGTINKSWAFTIEYFTTIGFSLVPNYLQMKAWLRPTRLLFAATLFHLLVTTAFYTLGRYQVLPATIDRYGTAVAIAPDGIIFRVEALQLSDELAHGQIRDWLNASSPLHIKVYSISMALLGPLFGSTILSVEPVNVFCYLAILVLVFHLGREIFSQTSGLIAATVVALWPSLLLHTTQLLRDPLFIAAMLGFVVINLRSLSKTLSWRSACLTALGGGGLAALIWLSRDTMRELLLATVGLAGLLFLLRQLTEKRRRSEQAQPWRIHLPSFVGMLLLIMLTVGVTSLIPKFRRPYDHARAQLNPKTDNEWQGSRRQKRDSLINSQDTSTNPWSRFVARVGKLRQGFAIEYSDGGSNIDSDVRIERTSDFIFYLPRAAAIGFFAPFPRMWFASGSQVNRTGRLLSGIETLGIYLVELLAIIAVWNRRVCLPLWFILLVAGIGMVSLGLVVINVGALYRLRYIFVIMLIIPAAEGATLTFEWLRRRRSANALT